MKRRNVIIIVGIIVLVSAGFIYQNLQKTRSAANSQFQTQPVERGTLTAQIGATGTVRANQTALLTWETTGQVGEVNFKVGDEVKTGDVLASLDPSTLPQTVILAQSDLVAARRSLDDLQTSGVARAQAQLNLELAQKALEDAEETRTNKDYQRSSQATLNEAEANMILAKNGLEQAQDIYGAVAAQDQNSVARAQALSALSNAQHNYDRALANYNYLLSRPDDQEVAEADAQLEVARANVDAAQREWDRLKDGPDPDDVAAAEARVQAIEATLAGVDLTAPFDGTITSVSVKPGDQVSMSAAAAAPAAAFRIDDLSRLLVDVEITEVDINQVKVGQDTNLSFDAILNQSYVGKVAEVARVGTVGLQGAVNFLVTIELSDADELVLPGMTAAVNIVTSQIDDVLLVPNRSVRLINGNRTVYILRDGQAVAETIQLGQSNESFSEVLSGNIKEGDEAILNPPAIFQPGGGGGPFGG
jgi:HlyD family secretion protein